MSLNSITNYLWGQICFRDFAGIVLCTMSLSVCLYVNRISQKAADGFGRNLVLRLGVWQGWINLILVKIQILKRIRELFKVFFFTIERLCQKRHTTWYFKTFWTNDDKTRWMSWWSDNNKPIQFCFRSGSRSGQSVAYKTQNVQPGRGMCSTECCSCYPVLAKRKAGLSDR